MKTNLRRYLAVILSVLLTTQSLGVFTLTASATTINENSATPTVQQAPDMVTAEDDEAVLSASSDEEDAPAQSAQEPDGAEQMHTPEADGTNTDAAQGDGSSEDGAAQGAGNTESAAQKADAPGNAAAAQEQPEENGASIHVSQGLYEAMVFGEDTADLTRAAQALSKASAEDPGVAFVSVSKARAMAATLFAAGDRTEPDGNYPRNADGSDIESISIKWITRDTDGYDNGDESRLYLVSDGDNPFSVRFQVDYALSGEHNYAPGDIEIRIPAQVFHKRDSNTTSENSRFTGNMVIPLAESPSTTTDFNWTLVGDEYVLTNTKTIIAATKGFIQFEIKDLIPHEIVDESITDQIQATIEVTTHLGNLIGLKSSKIDAQVNTTQEVVRANKGVTTKNNPKVITREEMLALDAIPEHIESAYPNEEFFVIVDWHTWSYHTGNQPYTLTAFDTRTDNYDGWVVKGDAKTRDMGIIQQGWYQAGTSSYSSMTTAFPLSQFDPDTTHVFKNHIDYHLVPIDEIDEPTDAGADAQVRWSYSEPEPWGGTEGHFNVFKWGNDDDWGKRSDGELTTHQVSSKSTGFQQLETGDIPTPWSQHLQTWYGIYPRALNDLRDGKDTRIDYTIKSEGYLLPWTCEGDTRVEENYGKRSVTMVTQDTGLWTGLTSKDIDFELVPLEDVDFISLNFVKPTIGKILRANMNPDGSPTNPYEGKPGFGYQADDDSSNIPPIKLEIQRNGAWEEYATADWSSDSCVITKVDGSVIQGDNVDFPSGTENFRTSVTSSNAYIYYYVRPLVELHPSAKWDTLIDELFAETETPMEPVWNGVNMVAYTHEGDEIVDISKVGHDRLLGYTPDIKVLPHKKGEVTSVDYTEKLVTLHYDAYIEERSVIADLTVYQQMLTEELLPKETHATWYDLLPEGVNPIMDSISLVREGDEIVDVYTIPNFKNTNRTLLVVEADLTPTPETYSENGVDYYEDKPQLSFDAVADLNYVVDHSEITESHGLRSYMHNVIVFESSNDEIGTVDGYRGEANDPNGTNNVATREAWSRYEAEAALEKAALTGLNSSRETESFLYAGDVTQVDILNTANTSIIKEVSVNNDGRWSQGTYYGNREANARDVYEGGMYSYRVFAISGQGTQSKNMIIYDSLENYVAIAGNDQEDVDAIAAGKRWRGALRSVDLSLLREKGIDPVLYYSTKPELKMQIVEDATEGYKNPETTDLTDTSVWVKASDYTGDLADVHAIAIDCRKAADGSDFILEPEEGITFYINMWAPTGEEADGYIQKDHHAYNNIFLEAVSVDAEHGGASEEHFIRQDYVKVGLVENNVTVTKVWDDDDDRDGLRPSEVTFTLLRDGVEYHPDSENPFAEEFENPVTVQADAEGKIEHTFKYLPYCDDEGNVFRYSVREDPVDGYKTTVRMGRDGKATVTNKHVPERTSVEGTKTWVGDSADVRPAAINVNLYADGVLVDTQQVTPDAQGRWNYKFENLYKYRDQGTEIVYTVDESAVRPGSLDVYVPAIDGTNIENTYHPFGDIELGKMVVGATDATADDVFVFELSMLDADGAPLTGKYDGDILNATGAVVRTESVTNGSSFELADGQTIHIRELPAGAQITATEKVTDGYTARNGERRMLTVKANQTRSHTFENVYRTSGYVNPEAGKTLKGRVMKNYQFTFKLTTDEAGEDVIATASSRVDGKVTFGAIRYKNEDAGKTYTYYLHENDRGKPGYTYDDAVYKVEVKVVDNGDGTMTCTPAYFQRSLAGTGWTPMSGKPVFQNEYHAKGDLELKAWKTLQKRDLKDKEFTFELVDPEGNVVEAKNDVTGVVTFPKLPFTEEHGGMTFDYIIREKAGTDNTVIYSTETYNVHVTVSDNGDGTLSFSTTITNEAGVNATPVFSNDLKDGKLAVEKRVEDGEAPVGEFRFKVKLTGPDVPEDGTYSFTKEQTTAGLTGIGTGFTAGLPRLLEGLLQGLATAGDQLLGLFAPVEVYAAPGDIASGTSGTMNWRITPEGVLILGKEGETQTPDSFTMTTPWWGNRLSVTSVQIAGNLVLPSAVRLFWGLENAESIEGMDKIDTSNMTSMYGMFTNCYKLEAVDLSHFDTTNVTSMQAMFQHCEALRIFDLSSFNTPNLTNMASMFQYCYAMEELNVSGFDTSNVTDMGMMFFLGPAPKRVILGSKWTKWLSSGKFPDVPSTLPYSGKWVHANDDGSIGPKTSGQLQGQYPANAATWAGEWVWEEPMYDVLFTTPDLNPASQKTVTLSYEDLLTYTLPDYDLDDSIFGGWVPSALSSSTGNLVRMQSVSNMNLISYAPTDSDRKVLDSGAAFAGAHVHAAPDGTTTAQKVEEVLKWLPLRSSNPYTIAFYAVTYDTYKVNFLPGEGATGSMSSLTDCPVDDDVAIPAPTFYKFNHHVTGWVDKEGNEFSASTIPAGTVKKPEITLTAKWAEDTNTVDMKNGEFEFTLKNNERAIFDKIPAGTAYQVWEETPAGWVLVQSVNTAGKIEPLETSTATFTNEYNPNAASAQITANKLLDNQPAPEAGKFSFTLSQGSTVLQTKTNAAGGGITFDPIVYERAGTYTYTIAEVGGNDPNIIYTGATYTATVTVKDDGAGKLTATVAYSGTDSATTPPTFRNESKPGRLSLQKKVMGTGAPTDAEFTFVVTLSATGDFPYRTESGTEGRIRNGDTITLKGNDWAYISGLPFGTTYSVTETSLPEGFTLAEEFNTSGTIEAEYTLVSFTNTYTPPRDPTGINLEVRKAMEWRELEAGQFTFTLMDGDHNVIGTASNDAAGKVVFDLIEYTDPGTYTYFVTEVEDYEDDEIIYDRGERVVTVTVTPDPADATKLVATPSYDPDDTSTIPTFTNSVNTNAGLVLRKKVEGATAAVAGKQFPFTLTLTGPDGNEVEGSFEWTKVNANQTPPAIVEQGTISSGGTLFMGDGEAIGISGLPYGTTYAIEEDVPGGFTVTSEKNEGTIGSDNRYPRASFVNTYAAYSELRLEAQKVLKGRPLTDGQFTFELIDENDSVISRATNDADGLVKFPAIGYTAEDDGKTYKYTIREVDSQDQGYTFDDTALSVTVKVTDKGDGTLILDKKYEGDSDTFKNVYKAEGSVELEATKDLSGRKLANEQFSFELVDVAPNKVIDTAANDAEGKVTFKAIPYTEADMVDAAGNQVTTKDFAYAIREVVPDPVPAGYTYDDHVEDVTVTVTDNGDGVLRATAAYDESGAVFENVYKASGEIGLEAKKLLSGRALASEQFTFELRSKEGDLIDTATCDAEGKVAFKAIAYTEADADKTFTYTINEVVPEEVPAGYTYDSDARTVDVKVTDNGDGTLTATPDYKGGSATFENVYEARGEVVLEGTKTLTGRVLEEGQFTFEAHDAEGALAATGTNDAEGRIVFEPIVYTQDDMVDEAGKPVVEKIFTYDVYEIDGEQPGYAYDFHTETVSVTVVDNGDGTLTATPTYEEDGLIIENTYLASGEAVIEASKVLEGRKLAEEQFTFELLDAGTGEVIETITNDADGRVTFTAINFDQDQLGPHDYIIREVVPEQVPAGYTYSDKTFGATITVTDNGDGTLDCAVNYTELPPAEEPTEEKVPTGSDVPAEEEMPGENDVPADETTPESTPVDAAVFVNVYEATGEAEISLKKTFEGGTLRAGQFSFVLKNEAGETLQTVKNAADGSISFEALKYTEADAGKAFPYKVTEVIPDQAAAGMTYDKHEETIEVTVSDNGDGTLSCAVAYRGRKEFVNKLVTRTPAPKTGDTHDLALLMIVMLAALLGFVLCRRQLRKA